MRKTSAVLCLAIFLALAVILGAWVSAHAAWVQVGTGSGVNVSVLESTPQRIVLEFTLGGFDRTEVRAGGRTTARILLPGEAVHLEKGLPELPPGRAQRDHS
jgi:hypothetical protein